MSASGHKPTWRLAGVISAVPLKADIPSRGVDEWLETGFRYSEAGVIAGERVPGLQDLVPQPATIGTMASPAFVYSAACRKARGGSRLGAKPFFASVSSTEP